MNHEAGKPPAEPPADSAVCLLCRCLDCGAAQLGDIEQKPERCATYGGSRLEFAQED